MKRKRTNIWQRNKIWWIQYFVRGVRHRESSRSTKEIDAKNLLDQRIAEVKAGRPVGTRVERTSLQELLAILVDDYRVNVHRSLDRLQFAIPNLCAYFGADARAMDITTDRITAYQVHRQQEGMAASTINYELAMLRRAFKLAARAGKVGVRPEFSMLRTDNARKGFFEAREYAAVQNLLPDYLKPVAQAAYITGWRTKSELLTRQWRHVDLDAGWLRLEPGEGKTAEGRMFPLTPELRTALEKQREWVRGIERATGRIIPWVFVHDSGTPIRNFRYSWEKACRQAGVTNRLVHDFRRTAVRNLERAGVPRSAAMKITGHKTETVYRRYAIVDEGMMREAAQKLAALHLTEGGQADSKPILGQRGKV